VNVLLVLFLVVCRGAARRFDISPSTAIRYQQRMKRTSCVAAFKRGRPSGSGKLAPYREMLIAKVEEQPDITMPELALFLFEQTQVSVTASNLSKLLCKAGYTYKKQLMASEQERSDVKREREEWRAHILPAIIRDMERVIFIDQTCVKTNMTPLRGRCLKGKRLKAHAPAGKWETSSFIAGLRSSELSAPFIIKGAIDGEAFVK